MLKCSGLTFFLSFIHVQLTPEQHGFELRGSTYMWIFYPANIVVSVFSFYRSLN